MTTKPHTTRDVTMDQHSLFGSAAWAALRCGLSRDRFRKNLSALENSGFPKPDRITGTYIKADVDTWVNRRRQLSDKIIEVRGSSDETTGVNFDEV